jgi:probable F420-dependent oxidoreductase
MAGATYYPAVHYGAVFPQAEFDRVDPEEIVAFVQRLEDAGYDHLIVYDHILGADTANRPGWNGPYDLDDPFLEPMVLFSYLARACRLEFVTSVMVLPQRQTALVAKQVATLSCLAPGRLRLGVGIGWNDVEYAALGMDFAGRAARLEEQVTLLRRLWSEPSVNHDGQPERVEAAGLAPLPPGPVPIWMGTGAHPRALNRVGRLADGWMPMPAVQPDRGLEAAWGEVGRVAAAEGRDPDAIGLEGQIWVPPNRLGTARERADHWAESGAAAVAINSLRCGARWPDGHLDLLLRAAEAIL